MVSMKLICAYTVRACSFEFFNTASYGRCRKYYGTINYCASLICIDLDYYRKSDFKTYGQFVKLFDNLNNVDTFYKIKITVHT